MSSHSVILRRYSTELDRENYSLYASAESLASANDIAEKASGNLGDIMIVCDTAYVSDLPKYAESIYVIDERGARLAPEVHVHLGKDITWLEAWEGSRVRAYNLLHAATDIGVERKLIALVGCACARTALRYVPEWEHRPRIAIETAEAFVRDDAKLEQLQKATYDIFRMPDEATACAVFSAKRACLYASSYALSSDNTYAAANAIYCAAAATGDYDTAICDLSSLVREYIPLSVVLLAARK